MENIEYEAKLIEQEHRVLSILINFFINRKKWNTSDPRRSASIKAFLFLFIPSLSTLAIGSIITFISLFFMFEQTKIMKKQNTLIQEQNSLIVKQLSVQQKFQINARRTELVKAIYKSKESTKNKNLYTNKIASNNSRIKSEALAEYIKLRKDEINIELPKFYKTKILPTAATLNFGIDLSFAPLQHVQINQLDLTNSTLSHSNFNHAELHFVDFSKAHMEYVGLCDSNLLGSNFKNTSLVGADLSGANLSNIEWNNETIVMKANIYGIINPPIGFVDWAIKNGAVEIKNKSVWIDDILNIFPALRKHITKPSSERTASRNSGDRILNY